LTNICISITENILSHLYDLQKDMPCFYKE
jgi:hypothetical protein